MSETAIKPKWGTYKVATRYSGISTRLLQVHVAEGNIRSALVKKPGSERGVRLIDLDSLDAFIEQGIGAKVDLEMNRNRKGASAQ